MRVVKDGWKKVDEFKEVPQKLEPWWLECGGQRDKHIERLKAAGKADVSPNRIFAGKEMATIMKKWRNAPETWMRPSSLRKIRVMRTQQDRHQGIHNRFGTFLLEIFGWDC